MKDGDVVEFETNEGDTHTGILISGSWRSENDTPTLWDIAAQNMPLYRQWIHKIKPLGMNVFEMINAGVTQ